ncbi:MAG: hypothetical protein ABGX22_19540 [Pirellulaceae bacterium]
MCRRLDHHKSLALERRVNPSLSHRRMPSLARLGLQRFGFGLYLACLLASPSAGQPSVADPSSLKISLAQRSQIDEQFQTELKLLADRCHQLGLAKEAAATLAFIVARDPGTNYYFVPPSASLEVSRPVQPNKALREASQFWWQHFQETRREYADALFEFCRRVVDTQPALAYQMLYEICWLDPDHDQARTVLGFKSSGKIWTRGSAKISVSQPRIALRDYGFSAREYWRIRSPHFTVLTNCSQEKGVALAESLEFFYLVWTQAFFDYGQSGSTLKRQLEAGKAPSVRSKRPYSVVFFRDRDQYNASLRTWEPMIDKTIGLYLAKRKKSFLYDAPSPPVQAWRHEVGHQLFAETVNTETQIGEGSDFWVAEALALYLESFRPYDTYATLGGRTADRLQFARYHALREGFRVPIGELVPWGRQEVQNHERLGALYSQFAGIAHFLIDQAPGHYRTPFIKYARDTYRNGEPTIALSDYLHINGVDLDAEYLKFLDVDDHQLGRNALGKSLYLARTSVTSAGIQQLDLSHLEWLDLSDTKVNDDILPQLAKATELRRLSLERTNLSSACLDAISECRKLRKLELGGVPLQGKSLATLAGLQELEGLWLVDTGINDAQLNQLYALKSLLTLDISRCKISQTAKQALQRALPKTKITGP